MNVSTNIKRSVPTKVNRYEYRYDKSNILNDFGMLVFQNVVKYDFWFVGFSTITNFYIIQYSNIPILVQLNG